jgi:hypothetical protein
LVGSSTRTLRRRRRSEGRGTILSLCQCRKGDAARLVLNTFRFALPGQDTNERERREARAISSTASNRLCSSFAAPNTTELGRYICNYALAHIDRTCGLVVKLGIAIFSRRRSCLAPGSIPGGCSFCFFSFLFALAGFLSSCSPSQGHGAGGAIGWTEWTTVAFFSVVFLAILFPSLTEQLLSLASTTRVE